MNHQKIKTTSQHGLAKKKGAISFSSVLELARQFRYICKLYNFSVNFQPSVESNTTFFMLMVCISVHAD